MTCRSRRICPPALPELVHATNLQVGESISLVGYEVQRVGDQVTVQLAWQARSTPARDFTVFVHLSTPDGAIFSQQDRPPSRPTSQWVPGEVIVDSYTLAIPKGSYAISVGMYLQENGFRLPINDASGVELGDEIRLVLQPE
jgi:hypothetical protein